MDYLQLQQVREFLQDSERRSLFVARLPNRYPSFLKIVHPEVILYRETYPKLFAYHKLAEATELLKIQYVIDEGFSYQDRPQNIVFLHPMADDRIYKVALKATKKRDKVILTTMHRIKRPQYTSLIKRAERDGTKIGP
ncbi:MAG: hypothetical protein ACPGOV_01645 [Magnetovibrionaceae bacterium]